MSQVDPRPQHGAGEIAWAACSQSPPGWGSVSPAHCLPWPHSTLLSPQGAVTAWEQRTNCRLLQGARNAAGLAWLGLLWLY